MLLDIPSNITDKKASNVFLNIEKNPSSTVLLPVHNNDISLQDFEGMCLTGTSTMALSGENIASLKYWKIYQENNLISDMVPAIHEDGRKGMYCKVRKIFLPIKTVV